MTTDPLVGDDAGTAPPATGPDDAPAAAGTPGAHGTDGTVTLPARDRDVLAFEKQWWRYAGAKEEAIRERFDLTATRYYQLLNAVIDRPEALAADPLLVRRLRRMRAARQRPRSRKVLGSERERS